MLSHIAAASAKDLEPVRLERLSSCSGGGDLGQPLQELLPTGTAGTEAYDLARRLVSSAGGIGSSMNTNSYTSAASKVRVSVKIPDRSPEDLPPGWNSELQINGQREAALVLFTYMRRGCIQLVLDMFSQVHACATLGTGTMQHMRVRADYRYGSQLTGRQHVDSPGAAQFDLGLSGSITSGRSTTAASEVQRAGGACASSEVLAAQTGTCCQKTDRTGDEVAGQRGTDACGTQSATAAMVLEDRLLCVISNDPFLAGRTITVQVGAEVSRVHVRAPPGSGASEPGTQSQEAPADGDRVPPNVRVQPQVICTANCWAGCLGRGLPGQRRHSQKQRDVVVSCWWDADGGSAASASCAAATSAKGPHPLELQITARQQGRFLPVALVATGVKQPDGAALEAVRAELAAGNVAVPVQRQGVVDARASGRQDGAAPSCWLAFAPATGDGSVQIELSNEGVHSAVATSVLLVSSPTVANELRQLQAVTTRDVGACAAKGAMVESMLRDFGAFLDIVPAMEGSAIAGGSGTRCDLPVFQWAAPPTGAPDGAPVPVHVPSNALGAGCAAGTGCQPDCLPSLSSTLVGVEEWTEHHHQRRLSALASVGSRLGFNLLRYFVSSGMPFCAARVLDVLHGQLGMPTVLIADYMDPEGMTLLHHAARSGSFETMAAVAGWLEARGVVPPWNACSATGLTPLHLLAVVPGGDAASALVQARWQAARLGWRRRKGWPHGCGASPAEFMARASRSVDATIGWQRAADTAVLLGVGHAWRGAVVLRRWAAPQGLARACRDLVAPALCFSHPDLEASYESWVAARTILMERIFLSLYTVYIVSQACKLGWAFLREQGANVLLLTMRICVVALPAPAWRFVQGVQRRLLPVQRRVDPSKEACERRRSGEWPSSWWCVTTREGKATLMEAMRLLVLLNIALGVLPLPGSWRLLLRLRLDWLWNGVIRPTASQMRVLPTIVTSSLALLGEAAVTVLVLWVPGSQTSVVWALALALARGTMQHAVGLGLTVLLQGSARMRFLAAVCERRAGVLSSKEKGW